MANGDTVAQRVKAALAPEGDPNAVCGPDGERPLHWLLDWHYERPLVEQLLDRGADMETPVGPFDETALHVATRRRRGEAVELLLDRGAAIDATTRGGKTAWLHAARRGFGDLTSILEARGADTAANDADRLAIALCAGRLDDATAIVAANRDAARSAIPEEARLLADLAGRDALDAVRLLLDAGAPLDARALDGGTALHQAGWFGQPRVTQLLLERGAPLEILCEAHAYTPLGWTVHGSRYSGGAAERQQLYLQNAELLLDAGAAMARPERLLDDASEPMAALLRSRGAAR